MLDANQQGLSPIRDLNFLKSFRLTLSLGASNLRLSPLRIFFPPRSLKRLASYLVWAIKGLKSASIFFAKPFKSFHLLKEVFDNLPWIKAVGIFLFLDSKIILGQNSDSTHTA